MRQIVGLLGVKGAGKDTCAKYLVDEANFVRVGFADALYAEVSLAYGVTVEFLGNRDTKETALAELSLSNCQNKDFVEVALAEAGSSSEEELAKPRSPRWVMQLWGTEYRRKSRFGVDSYWLDQVRQVMEARPTTHFVVTDVRFKNEAEFITRVGGVLARIRRPVLEAQEEQNRIKRGTAAHSSETELLGYPVNLEIMNVEGDQNSLRDGALQLVAEHIAL